MSAYQESDEKTHAPSSEMDFNESMYLNYFDDTERIGGFLRVANRPNEGFAEVTSTTFLPDGSVLFSYQKPAIKGNRNFEAGGMQFEVIEPFKKLKLSYAGKVFHFSDPGILKDPKKAYTESPQLDFQIRLDVAGLGAIHDNVDRGSKALQEVNYWKEHYEQIIKVDGRVTIGDQDHPLKGLGLRDHSWGPRTWQSPKYYRFLSAVFDDRTGFGLMFLATTRGLLSKKGFLSTPNGVFDLKDIRIETEYTGPENYHHLIHLELATADGVFRFEGRVLSLLPLRNRKEGRTVRIAEGMTEWKWNGTPGYGLSEYLDHMGG
jgi:hypothetical protein